MEKTNPLSNQPSYFDQLVDLASHTVVGAGAGALVSKVFVPLALQQGAIVGAAVGTATGLVQKLVHMGTGQEETPLSNGLIAAATLGALFFGATTYPATAASLLGRIGLDLSKDAIMKLCIGSFVGEVALAAIKNILGNTPTAEEQVGKLSKEELKEAFTNFDAWTKAADEKTPAKIPVRLHTAFMKRFADENLYVAPTTAKEVTDAHEHVIVHFFTVAESGTITDVTVKSAIDARVETLKLAEKPATKEAVEKMSPAQIYWAFSHYVSFTSGMDKEVKEALNAKIEAKLAPKPTKADEVAAMTSAQLVYALANYTAFTKGMDSAVVTALDIAIVKAGLATAKKPADLTAVQKLSDFEVRAIHAQHATLFGAKPDYKDLDVIKKLNGRYMRLTLGKQVEPTKPVVTPNPTVMERITGLAKGTFGAIRNNPGKSITAATLVTAKTAGWYFGYDVPYVPFI